MLFWTADAFWLLRIGSPFGSQIVLLVFDDPNAPRYGLSDVD